MLGYLLHVDVYLSQLVDQVGVGAYAILFLTVFAEIGLVVFAFLPGESLLLAGGTLASLGILDITVLAPLLFLAAFTGIISNFLIGRVAGRRLLARPRRFFKPTQVQEVHDFYEKHGGLTIAVARFLPVVRSLAPFMAGVARLEFARLVLFAAIASLAWVGIFLGSGYWLGTADWVQKYLALVLVGITLATALPGLAPFVRRYLRYRRARRQVIRPLPPAPQSID